MFNFKITLVLLFFLFGNVGGIYSQTMVVTDIEKGIITCVDFNGNKWTFKDNSKDWQKGDFASCCMYDNGTEMIYDDIILSAKYCGWLCGSWGWDGQQEIMVVE